MNLDLRQINGEQIRIMKHALGLNRNKEIYRNYYNCNASHKDWNDLVQKGFATKSAAWTDDTANFHVTDEAIELIKYI